MSTGKPESPPALGEFLFGPLTSLKGRLAAVRTESLGFFPLSLQEPLDPRPGEPVRVTCRTGNDVELEAVLVFWRGDGGDPEWNEERRPLAGTGCVAARRGEAFWDLPNWGYGEEWMAELPPQEEGTLLQYVILGIDASGHVLSCPGSHPFPAPGMPERSRRPGDDTPHLFAVSVDRLEPPGWLRSAVIYQVMVDRFSPDPGKGFKKGALTERLGGTLLGVASRLDYLASLGVDTLWLSPIVASPDYHGYAASDYLEVEPALGGEGAWRTLVEEARKRGMRIILDFVANHVSDTHPAFREAVASPKSPLRSWFRFSGRRNYSAFFDVASQPELDTENPEVRRLLLDAARYWLREGCDGFRLDYALGLSHGAWSRLRKVSREEFPESTTIGEITAPPRTLRSYAGRMDGCLDFLLCELLRGVFAHRTLTMGAFDQQVRRHLEYFGDRLVLPSFLDNHDMSRFLWVCGSRERLRLAALCQFCLPGPPVVYYGTEIGLSQHAPCGPLEESRLPMPPEKEWDLDLLQFYSDLVRLRRLLRPWFHRPVPLLVDDARDLLCWRVGEALLVISRSLPNRVTLPASRLLLATSPGVSLSPSGTVELPAESGALLATPGSIGDRHAIDAA